MFFSLYSYTYTNMFGGGDPILCTSPLLMEGGQFPPFEPGGMGENNVPPIPIPDLNRPEWELALDLPDDEPAPEALVDHTKEECKILFNIGKRCTLPEAYIRKQLKPLKLDAATVGFLKRLLAKVRDLQMEHYNRGNHIKLTFKTQSDKDRLYSIMWDKSF